MYYSEKHKNIIQQNIQKIKLKARKKEIETTEPSIEEFRNVSAFLKTFIKKKKRIVYGGYALNIITNGECYNESIDFYDMEIYTPKPIEDIKEICDNLYDLKYKYVICEEAFHKNTFSIFVNFIHYIDITYIPIRVYEKIETFVKKDFVIPKNRFLLIDMLRVFNDPITSYWRLEKTVPRYFQLIEHHSISNKSYILNSKLIKLKKFPNKISSEILGFLIKNIATLESVTLVGYLIYNLFEKKNGQNSSLQNIPYIEIFVDDFENDIAKISKILTKYFNKPIKIIYNTNFIDLMDRSASLYMGSSKIIFIVSKNLKCIPYLSYKINDTPVKICSYTQLLQYFLVKKLYFNVHNNYLEMKITDDICKNLVVLRNIFYNKNPSLNPLSKTIFREFVVPCKGKTVSAYRLKRLEVINKFKKRLPVKFRYSPENPQNLETLKKSYKLNENYGKIYKKATIK